MTGLHAAFARVDITPDRPVSLLGYFSDRRSQGVRDRLHCRIAAISRAGQQLLFVQVDSCLFGTDDAVRLARAASRGRGLPVERVMVFASHTHTAPALADLYAARRDAQYMDFLESRVHQAAAGLGRAEPVQLQVCRSSAPGLASNRRWWLSDGTVATNPPRMHPSLVRPEGPVDDEANTISFLGADGIPRCLFVSISNHVDTIGGNLVSADWPGIMEAEVGKGFPAGQAPLVMLFIGAAGNINHFDFRGEGNQSSYAEASRIGCAYAEVVRASLGSGVEARGEPMSVALKVLRVPGIEISDGDKERARELLGRDQGRPLAAADVTAEDIFAGDPEVERIFARALLDLVRARPDAYEVPLQLMRLGGIGFFAIPGEPFVEIGLALKALPGFDLAVPVGLANGYFGYISLAENFGRGGYETRPGPTLLCRNAASLILDAFTGMVRE